MARLRDRAFVALDNMTIDTALPYLRTLADKVAGVKFTNLLDENAQLITRTAMGHGLLVWADAKLYDIPATVGSRANTHAMNGADIVTVHASGGVEMVRAAVERYREGFLNSPRRHRLGIFAVTTLTSWPDKQAAVNARVAKHATELAGTGIGGLVCSPLELKTLAAHPGRRMIKIATPGVYFEHPPIDRHARYSTIADALANGADYVVIGREIVNARDPVGLIHRIDESIAHI